MGRLTFSEDGKFGVVGMNADNEEEKLYGCICKLKDYENTGLSPDEVERLLDEEPRKPTRRAQSIVQIISAHEAVATFGRREIDADGTIKKQITERIPVICWALVTDDEFYVMGMVAQEAGEIILVNQRDDFLEYETAANTSKAPAPCRGYTPLPDEDPRRAIDKKTERVRRGNASESCKKRISREQLINECGRFYEEMTEGKSDEEIFLALSE